MFFTVHIVEPWQSPKEILARLGGSLAPGLKDALSYAGSLTRFLETLWHSPVGVRVESQTVMGLWLEDVALWNSSHTFVCNGMILRRDAWLTVAGKDWIFAHSQVAVNTLPEGLRNAIDDGSRPLGSLFLDREGDVSREHLELAVVRVPEVALRQGLPEQTLFWCRRSLLKVNGTLHARIMELFLTSV